MKREVLIVFLLAMVMSQTNIARTDIARTDIARTDIARTDIARTDIVLANDRWPYSASALIDYNLGNCFSIPPETPIRPDKSVIFQSPKERYRYYYPVRMTQYPLFYYLPGLKEAKLSLAQISNDLKSHDFNDMINEKSEQAIKRNNLNNKEFISTIAVETPTVEHNEVNLSGSDLSEITASSLILSARKKQRLEILIPALLNNQRLFLHDRERLQKLLNDCKSSKRITSGDEIWLQKLSEEYYLPEIQPTKKKADDVLGTVSQLKKGYPGSIGR